MTVRTHADTGGNFSHSNRAIAVLLFFLTLVLRLSFQSQTLNHWDSVNHALALTSFNIAAHRPQPPGYILYIGIARLVNFVFPDAQTALVVVSILASALAVAFLFLLGARMSSRAVGFIAALLWLTSPPFWFDGEVALPYVVEGCASVMLAYLVFRVLTGENQLAPLAAVVFAISIGLRQQMAFFFAPLVMYVFWKYPWRVRLEALAWFTLVCLLWFVPLMASAGGVSAYFAALRNLNTAFADEFVLSGTGGLSAFGRNAARMSAYVLYALNLATIPLGVAVIHFARTRALVSDPRARFFALWILPSAIFYLFFHMGSPGLIYVFLPALLLLAALGLEKMTRAQPRWQYGATALLCAFNVFLFLGTPSDLYTGRAVRVLNYSALQEHDRSLTARVNAIRQNFDPATTLVIADDWRFAEYYLPNFRVLFLPSNANEPLIVSEQQREKYLRANALDISQIEMLVWFDETSAQKYRGKPQVCLALQNGACLPVVHLAQKGGVKIVGNQIEARADE